MRKFLIWVGQVLGTLFFGFLIGLILWKAFYVVTITTFDLGWLGFVLALIMFVILVSFVGFILGFPTMLLIQHNTFAKIILLPALLYTGIRCSTLPWQLNVDYDGFIGNGILFSYATFILFFCVMFFLYVAFLFFCSSADRKLNIKEIADAADNNVPFSPRTLEVGETIITTTYGEVYIEHIQEPDETGRQVVGIVDAEGAPRSIEYYELQRMKEQKLKLPILNINDVIETPYGQLTIIQILESHIEIDGGLICFVKDCEGKVTRCKYSVLQVMKAVQIAKQYRKNELNLFKKDTATSTELL